MAAANEPVINPVQQEQEHKEEQGWEAPSSARARSVFNPIRDVVDTLKIPQAPADKPMIPLSLGDPTVFGNLGMHTTTQEALLQGLASSKFNGYGPSVGLLSARESIASVHSTPEAPLTADDVVLTSGGSGAINLCIQSCADEGDNILVPQPGFPLYATIASTYGIQIRHYNLLPERSWEADLEQLETLVDARTRLLVLNNPANPTGSVFSRGHLQQLLDFARRHHLVVLSDEIYGKMVFSGHTFHPLASLCDDVPILTVSGLAKQYLCPGWRVGWILMHNKRQRLRRVIPAIKQMSQLILGPCTLIQSAIPAMLNSTPPEWYEQLNATLEAQAGFIGNRLAQIKGLRPVAAQGAMYTMVEVLVDEFEGISDGTQFAQLLLNEQFVFVLPGSCFGAPNFFRIVFCAPEKVLADACSRIEEFCTKYAKKQE